MTIRRYTVTDAWKDQEVTLEVDHSILTPELAKEVNEFWSSASYRRGEEDGDDVRAVVRFAGMILINMMLGQGGSEFTENGYNGGFGSPGPDWTKDLHDEEGFPSDSGIRCVAASVSTSDYSDVELKEVT